MAVFHNPDIGIEGKLSGEDVAQTTEDRILNSEAWNEHANKHKDAHLNLIKDEWNIKQQEGLAGKVSTAPEPTLTQEEKKNPASLLTIRILNYN